MSGEAYELPDEINTVAGLLSHLVSRGENFATVFKDTKMVRVAVNQLHARPDHPISNSDEIAFFPPVTGG